MLDLSLVNAKDVIKLDENIQTVIGVCAFAFTTVGSVFLKCFLSARKNRKRAQEERRMIEVVVGAVKENLANNLKVTDQVQNIEVTQDMDLETEKPDKEQFEVVEVVIKGSPQGAGYDRVREDPTEGKDTVYTPRLTKSQGIESLNKLREW